MEKLPIYELKINESLNDDSEVSYVALVDNPAIQRDFLAFNDEFIEPSKGEHETDFLPRCIKYVIDEGKDPDQAVAICNSIWSEHFAEETYNDYPEAAKENAKIALRWAEQNGWGSCGTPVGKARANQLANGENISRDTIGRMAAFERHRQNSQKELGDGCGRLMWLAWGGDEGIAWAQRKLQQIDSKMAAEKVSIDYDDTLSTDRGKELAKRLISEGKTVYIISARQDKEGMLSVASELGIPEGRVYATGSNSAKIEKIKELGIVKHYDNNADVVKELGSIGSKFAYSFQVVSEEEKIISGPLMLADQLIYRNNEQFGEHYVKFSRETIKSIAIKFSKRQYMNHVNLMHDQNKKVDGVTMFESFIVDKKRGIMPMVGFEDVADGSWFGSFYVENPKVWDKIKSGELKGFSVEGLFDYESTLSAEEEALQKISKLLESDESTALQQISEILKGIN
jgi:hypothetical protein